MWLQNPSGLKLLNFYCLLSVRWFLIFSFRTPSNLCFQEETTTVDTNCLHIPVKITGDQDNCSELSPPLTCAAHFKCNLKSVRRKYKIKNESKQSAASLHR